MSRPPFQFIIPLECSLCCFGLIARLHALLQPATFDEPSVFVDDNVARLRWITLGASRDGRVEAASGLAAGERIVTAPSAELADGRRVELAR